MLLLNLSQSTFMLFLEFPFVMFQCLLLLFFIVFSLLFVFLAKAFEFLEFSLLGVEEVLAALELTPEIMFQYFLS
jgi:hypothetical protein